MGLWDKFERMFVPEKAKELVSKPIRTLESMFVPENPTTQKVVNTLLGAVPYVGPALATGYGMLSATKGIPEGSGFREGALPIAMGGISGYGLGSLGAGISGGIQGMAGIGGGTATGAGGMGGASFGSSAGSSGGFGAFMPGFSAGMGAYNAPLTGFLGGIGNAVGDFAGGVGSSLSEGFGNVAGGIGNMLGFGGQAAGQMPVAPMSTALSPTANQLGNVLQSGKLAPGMFGGTGVGGAGAGISGGAGAGGGGGFGNILGNIGKGIGGLMSGAGGLGNMFGGGGGMGNLALPTAIAAGAASLAAKPPELAYNPEEYLQQGKAFAEKYGLQGMPAHAQKEVQDMVEAPLEASPDEVAEEARADLTNLARLYTAAGGVDSSDYRRDALRVVQQAKYKILDRKVETKKWAITTSAQQGQFEANAVYQLANMIGVGDDLRNAVKIADYENFQQLMGQIMTISAYDIMRRG